MVCLIIKTLLLFLFVLGRLFEEDPQPSISNSYFFIIVLIFKIIINFVVMARDQIDVASVNLLFIFESFIFVLIVLFFFVLFLG
jgi:hypothetical protein